MKRHSENGSFRFTRVLVVADKLQDAVAVESILKAAKTEKFKITAVSGISAGIEALGSEDIEAVIHYLSLNDPDSLIAFRSLHDHSREIPFIVLTDRKSETGALNIIREGAEDVLLKDHCSGEAVSLSISFAIERNRLKKTLRKTSDRLERSLIHLKKTNKKMIEEQKSAVEEERLKVILMMTGAAAHEIKQPLTAILGNIELMKMFEKIPPELEKYIAEIKGAGKKINEIVSSGRELYDVESGSLVRDIIPIKFDRQINVLSVEDSDRDFESIQTSLSGQERIRLKRAQNFIEALDILKKDRIDVVLMDYLLPDGNGLDFLKKIKSNGPDVPVIVVTGQGDELIASRFIKEGAFDYFPKGRISAGSLCRSISNTLEKARLKKEIVHTRRRLADLSIRDELTGLYNRRFFMETLKREMARAGRFKTELVLCMMDLDHFKDVNDTYGHPAGDSVLSKIGVMLGSCVRLGDYSCRYGGEEFALILPNTPLEKARSVCERFREMVASHDFEYNSHDIKITISIGIANYKGFSNESAAGIVSAADHALYSAKQSGRNRVDKAAMNK